MSEACVEVRDFPASGRPPRVLIVLHQEQSTPGRVGKALQARGFHLDIRRPRFGDSLPASLDEHAGAVVFGGPMSANDTDAFIHREIDWHAVPLKEEAPYLGICLGAQMLARHLGARVYGHPEGLVEIGYFPIEPTEAGAATFEWPRRVYQWHREGFDLPAGADLLASGGGPFPNQAIRVGPAAYGVQFHPELTLAMVHRWTTIGHERLKLPGAQPRPVHFADRLLYDAAVREWLDRFLDHWIGRADGVPAGVAPPPAD
jgi:GMP synthase (glutamine-hydrolysing)